MRSIEYIHPSSIVSCCCEASWYHWHGPFCFGYDWYDFVVSISCILVLLEKHNILLGFGHGDFKAWTTRLFVAVGEWIWKCGWGKLCSWSTSSNRLPQFLFYFPDSSISSVQAAFSTCVIAYSSYIPITRVSYDSSFQGKLSHSACGIWYADFGKNAVCTTWFYANFPTLLVVCVFKFHLIMACTI